MTRFEPYPSVAELGRQLRAGELSSSDLVERTLARIEAVDPLVRAFIAVTAQRAVAEAARADAELAAGVDRGPLHGIPYALKDIIDVAGIPTTCNSTRMLGNVPGTDAEVVRRLKAGGGVFIGKLNTAEFALGGGEDLPFRSARNPWNLDHFAGTSSSGSAVAVAAGLVPFAIGSDTGGSIRSPACHCGVVGLKPTYGLVSRRGVYPLSYSLDHVGSLTNSAGDAATVLAVIAGFDPLDPSSVEAPAADYGAGIGNPIAGVRVGYARGIFDQVAGVSPEVVESVDRAARTLAGLGATVETIPFDDFDVYKACGRIIMLAEAFAVHEQALRDHPEAYGRYTFQRIAAGATISAADYLQALRLRRELTVHLNRGPLRRYDLLLTTTGLTPAARLDEFPVDWPPPGLSVAVQTAAFNVTGNPVLAVPSGFSSGGLPMGVQLIGRPFGERLLFQVGAAFEAATALAAMHPALGEPERTA